MLEGLVSPEIKTGFRNSSRMRNVVMLRQNLFFI